MRHVEKKSASAFARVSVLEAFRLQTGVTVTAIDGRQRGLELPSVFQCSETITFRV